MYDEGVFSRSLTGAVDVPGAACMMKGSSLHLLQAPFTKEAQKKDVILSLSAVGC